MSCEIQEFRGIAAYSDLPPSLVSGVEGCIASAFGGGITQEDARAHMTGDQIVVARAQLNGSYDVAGFSSTSIVSPAEVFADDSLESEKGGYFAGAAISRDVQGKGLYGQINRRRIDFVLGENVDFIFTRTQNPRVQEGITSLVDKLVDEGVIGTYGLERVISRGAYGRMLTTTKPNGRKLRFDDLDYERGDAAVLTWRLDK